jgi:hypothetical protein
MACADTASDKVKPATTINLIILSSLGRPITPTSQIGNGPASCSSTASFRRRPLEGLEIDQGWDNRCCEKSMVFE